MSPESKAMAFPLRRATRVALALVLLAAVPGCGGWTGFGFDARGREMQRIREALALKPGMTVADIGAGKGELSAALAGEVGRAGRVYATDLDPGRVATLRGKFAGDGLAHVTVVEAGSSDTRLPPGCCDAIVLRRVYHHLAEPAAINASFLRTLRPGGVLLVIDFPPPLFFGRGDFGVPSSEVLAEVTREGFQLVRRSDDWPGRGPMATYALLFRRPP